MEQHYHEHTDQFDCSLCHGKRYRRIPFRYAFRGRFIWAVRCSACGLVSLFPQPSDEEIEEMYAEAYFTEEDVQTHHYQKDYVTAVEGIDHSEKIASLKKLLPASGRVLEVGSATGELLNALRQEGFEVKGVEISGFAAKVAREKYGLEVINDAFGSEGMRGLLPGSYFDLILMGDVLEHFRDPAAALRYACGLLKPGGALIANVPSTLHLISSRLAFLIYRLTGSQKTMTIPPYHLTEFFPATLKKMFLASGFSHARVVQDTKHPKTIALRHSGAENLIKLAFQYPNYMLTKWFGIFGDRLTCTGIR